MAFQAIDGEPYGIGGVLNVGIYICIWGDECEVAIYPNISQLSLLETSLDSFKP